MITGVAAVVLGMIWGIQMSATQDHSLSPAHAHLNLLGFVSFSIFAFYYHLVPQAAQSRLAEVHYWSATTGLVTLIPGIVMALTERGEVLAQLGSVLSLVSMLIFALVLLRPSTQAVGQAQTP